MLSISANKTATAVRATLNSRCRAINHLQKTKNVFISNGNKRFYMKMFAGLVSGPLVRIYHYTMGTPISLQVSKVWGLPTFVHGNCIMYVLHHECPVTCR